MSLGNGRKLDRTNWPIAAAMIQYPGLAPDGRSTQDQSAEEWSATLADIAGQGRADLGATREAFRLAVRMANQRRALAAAAE